MPVKMFIFAFPTEQVKLVEERLELKDQECEHQCKELEDKYQAELIQLQAAFDEKLREEISKTKTGEKDDEGSCSLTCFQDNTETFHVFSVLKIIKCIYFFFTN